MDLRTHLFDVLRRPWPIVSNIFIKLSSAYTSTILGFMIFYSLGKIVIGNPIACFGMDDISSDVLNIFCLDNLWIITNPTQPISSTFNDHPEAIGTYSHLDTAKFYSIYAWIPCFLFAHLLASIGAYFFWRNHENGLLKTMLLGERQKLLSVANWSSTKSVLVSGLARRFGRSGGYIRSIIILELWYLVSPYLNLQMMDFYLQIPNYGLYAGGVANQSLIVKNGVSIENAVFPDVARCHFPLFGSGGNLVPYECTCVLSMSLLYKKYYIFLWYFFACMQAFAVFWILRRSATVYFKCYRTILLHELAPGVPKALIARIIRLGNYGDYAFLYLLGYNMIDFQFEEVIVALANQISDINHC